MNDTLDLDEAAALLKANAETVRQMAADGTLLGAQVGRAWVFLREDLLTYLRNEIRNQTRRAALYD